MRVKIADIPDGRSTADARLKLAFPKSETTEFVGETQCRAHLDKFGSQICVRLEYKGVVRLQCSRCLGSFEKKVRGEFRLLNLDNDSSNPNEEDIALYYDKEKEAVDLAAAVYDDAVTGLPMKPLCSVDCEGQAGSREMAREKSGEVDPRWAPLEKLRKKS